LFAVFIEPNSFALQMDYGIERFFIEAYLKMFKERSSILNASIFRLKTKNERK